MFVISVNHSHLQKLSAQLEKEPHNSGDSCIRRRRRLGGSCVIGGGVAWKWWWGEINTRLDEARKGILINFQV